MNSHVSKEMGITMARWVLKMVGQQGGVKINSNIYDHNSYDLGKDESLERKQVITLGTKGELITVEDALSFLKKLEKYGDNEAFDNGRSYYFEGIFKTHKGYEFAWGS